jgi:hypothetical protein
MHQCTVHEQMTPFLAVQECKKKKKQQEQPNTTKNNKNMSAGQPLNHCRTTARPLHDHLLVFNRFKNQRNTRGHSYRFRNGHVGSRAHIEIHQRAICNVKTTDGQFLTAMIQIV